MHILFALVLCLPLVSQDEHFNNTTLPEEQNYDDIVFRVVNGQPANLGQIPYQISLKTRGDRHAYMIYTNFCGGSLVGRDKILSAGHCFFSEGNACQKACKKKVHRNLKNVYAVAGTLRTRGYYQSDHTGTEQWRKLRTFLVPSNYNFPQNDIALAFTEKPFVINQYVRALPMAQVTRDYGSIDCLVSGYGRISNRIISDSLLWATLRLIPQTQCSLSHRKNMQKFICTSSDISDVLQGDSGGPLVCKGTNDLNDLGEGVIVGVVSGAEWSSRSGRWQTFFTRVSSYRKFYLQSGETTPALSQICIYVLVLFTFISKFGYSILFHFSRFFTA